MAKLTPFLTAAPFVAAALAMAPASAQTGGPPVMRVEPASTGAVFIPRATFDKAISARPAPPAGTPVAPGAPAVPLPGLSSLGSVRAGDDRINIDTLKRVDAKAEGPVSHLVVTEVYYILDGGGIMETGGTIPDAKPMLGANGKPVNPANIGPSVRGEQIIGGTQHHVGVGDAIMIPPNVPHRFLSLDGSVTYMVVRINPGFERGR